IRQGALSRIRGWGAGSYLAWAFAAGLRASFAASIGEGLTLRTVLTLGASAAVATVSAFTGDLGDLALVALGAFSALAAFAFGAAAFGAAAFAAPALALGEARLAFTFLPRISTW